MRQVLVAFLVLVCCNQFVFCQVEQPEEGSISAEETVVVTDSAQTTVQDTTPKKKQKRYRNFGDTVIEQHSFKKAMWLSAVLPGLGQVYNSIGHPAGKNRYWKIPIIYAGLGAMTYFIIDNQRKRNQFVDEYNYRYVDSTGSSLYPEFQFYDEQALITGVDNHTFYRDLSIFGLVVVYALNIVDAAVDAHFYNFHLGKTLDMSWTPYASPVNSAMGLTLNFNFKAPSRQLSSKSLIQGF